MEIAKTILSQLGGNKFIAMTGSKNFISDGNTLRMSLSRNKTAANRLYITLEGDDTYTMKFFKATGGRFKIKPFEWIEYKETIVAEFEGIYCDMLQDMFTEVTGMDTHL